MTPRTRLLPAAQLASPMCLCPSVWSNNDTTNPTTHLGLHPDACKRIPCLQLHFFLLVNCPGCGVLLCFVVLCLYCSSFLAFYRGTGYMPQKHTGLTQTESIATGHLAERTPQPTGRTPPFATHCVQDIQGVQRKTSLRRSAEVRKQLAGKLACWICNVLLTQAQNMARPHHTMLYPHCSRSAM